MIVTHESRLERQVISFLVHLLRRFCHQCFMDTCCERSTPDQHAAFCDRTLLSLSPGFLIKGTPTWLKRVPVIMTHRKVRIRDKNAYLTLVPSESSRQADSYSMSHS